MIPLPPPMSPWEACCIIVVVAASSLTCMGVVGFAVIGFVHVIKHGLIIP